MRSSQPSAKDAEAAAPPARVVWTVAAVVAATAFALYHATLLPGVDFGDSGSFQTTVGSPILTPRVGYPLYFAIGGAFLRLTGLEPARALNLATSLEAAIACGLFVVVATELAGSVAAAAAGAALMALSYTFWSQSVTAEVYALHLALTLLSLQLLLRWERRPSLIRLSAFFAGYALAFGNHLSIVLAAPAFTAFLLIKAPGGWKSMFRPQVIAIAIAIALGGAAQYLWNVSALWFQPDAPPSIADAFRTFWFDVTKADWRDTMVLEVPRSLLTDHAAMYWFDLHQQFGIEGPVLAIAGLVSLAVRQRARSWLLALLYLANVVFAFSYNVGDTHVFYLPSHLIVALLVAVGIAGLGAFVKRGTVVLATAIAVYAGIRGYHDFPALDRSRDLRPTAVLQKLTDGIDDQRAILLVDLNWQVANGLSYYAKSVRPELAVARARDVLLYAPRLVRDNVTAGRQVIASEQATRILKESYGPLLATDPDTTSTSLSEFVRAIPRGARYAMCVVKQSQDMAIDRADLTAALLALGTATPLFDPLPAFVIIAGVAGEAPILFEGADRPFRRAALIAGTPVEVRMDAWMTSDTIRRMGFGHIIAARHHTLIVERGVSIVTFDESGSTLETGYFSGIFALPRRNLIRTAW